MKSITLNHTDNIEQTKIEMIDFYNEATEDYKFWSKDLNMHLHYTLEKGIQYFKYLLFFIYNINVFSFNLQVT